MAKLLFFWAFFCTVLCVESAIAPGRLGGSSHFHYARNSSRGRVSKNKHHSSSLSTSGTRNSISHSFSGHYKSFYSNYTSASLVAPYRSQTATVKSHHMARSNSSNDLVYHYSTSRTAHGMHSAPTAIREASLARTSPAKAPTRTQEQKRSPLNMAPTPAPTTDGSPDTTVHINDATDFALLLPNNDGELISDAESDGVAFCLSGGCSRAIPDGFITGAAVERAPDGVSWIQVTGCIDPSKASLSLQDDGGQFDVRFPDGAQCTFGGYGASFIEQVEPSANRFCLRCCATENDQTNCNSHQDRAGCPIAIPGTYDFPDKGVSCA